ncbi:collagen alpha-2(XI) chain-like [Lampetra planeri]
MTMMVVVVVMMMMMVVVVARKKMTVVTTGSHRGLVMAQRHHQQLMVVVLMALMVVAVPASSAAHGNSVEPGEEGSAFISDEVDVLAGLRLGLSWPPNVTRTRDEVGCPAYHVGQWAVLALPLQRAFGYRFSEEVSVLTKFRVAPLHGHRDEDDDDAERGGQDAPLFTLLSPRGQVLMQLRVGDRGLVFVTTRRRHYEFPAPSLSDGRWHRVALAVGAQRLDVTWTAPCWRA